ncbi:MAG: hypothetical protein DSY35_00570 [Desulfurobacterium sp.]|nr:MAG: hypothetical protein DSY35_00570 [Desulfurobacterium sp.]
MKRVKGFTLVELAVVVAVSAIILWLGYNSFKEWKESSSIENDVQRIYSEIQKERLKAFTQKKKVEITCSDKRLRIKETDLDSGKVSFSEIALNNPFEITNSYKKIKINEKGLFSLTGKIEVKGTYRSSPEFDCIVISRNRIRMEKCK